MKSSVCSAATSEAVLDTRVLLSAAGAPERLASDVRALLDDPDNQPIFSAASLWEIAIKRALGRDDFAVDARALRHGLLDNGYFELPVSGEHAVAVDALPAIHKDPFDRILVAQAIVESVTLLTSDAIVARYPGPVRKI